MTLTDATLANISFSDSKIKIKHGTAAEWAAANPTLEAGEAGFETDTYILKIGDGTTAYTSLSPVIGTNAAEGVTLAMLADLARGSIITGQTANNRPSALDAKGNGKILIGNGTDLASVSMSGDATISNAGIVSAASPVKRKIAHLTAGLCNRSSSTAPGISISSGSDVTYYTCFCAPYSISIVGMVTYLNAEYIKNGGLDAVITLKDRTASPVTKVTYALPAEGAPAKTMITTAPVLQGLAAGDVLDLYITSTGAGGSGNVDVFLVYTIDGE